MLQAFIITLREGVEAALIVGITLAYLAKIGRNDLRKSVYAALGAAFAGSITVAVVLSRLNWNQDIFEGWVMLVAAVFVVTMIVFMMKTGRKLKGEIESKVGLFARGDAWIGLFLFVFLMVLFEMKRRQPTELPPAGAARRKALWTARRERLWMASVYTCSFIFIAMVTASFIYEKSASALSPATEVTFVDGKVSIPVKAIYDGELHRYETRKGGVEVRFWLYQKPDGKIATLFDACQICGGVGFYKGSNGVICKNCAAPINPQSVGLAGGCNPIPLKAEVTADAVIVSEADIAAGRHYFEQK